MYEAMEELLYLSFHNKQSILTVCFLFTINLNVMVYKSSNVPLIFLIF